MRRILVFMIAVFVVVLAVHPAVANDDLFDTKAAIAHVERGIDALKHKKYDSAINEFEEALSIDPNAEAYYYLGYAYYMKGKMGDGESRKKSIDAFDKAYELDPSFTPNEPGLTEAPQPSRKGTPSKTEEMQAPAVSSEPTESEPAPGVSVMSGGPETAPSVSTEPGETSTMPSVSSEPAEGEPAPAMQ